MKLKLENFLDSYDHYRGHVGLGFWRAIARALHYELTGRDRWEI